MTERGDRASTWPSASGPAWTPRPCVRSTRARRRAAAELTRGRRRRCATWARSSCARTRSSSACSRAPRRPSGGPPSGPGSRSSGSSRPPALPGRSPNRLKEDRHALPSLPPIALAAIALAAVALVSRGRSGAATAAPTWSRISGPTQAGVQLGLARTADGVLHVIWNRGNSPTSIFETRLSPAGKAVGTSTVATGWRRERRAGARRHARQDAAAVRVRETGGINTFTAPAAGGSWTSGGADWGGAIAESARDRGDAGEGRPAGDRVARETRGEGVPPGIDRRRATRPG